MTGVLGGAEELVAELRAVEVAARQAYARMLELIAELDASGFVGQEGYGTTARMLSALLHLSAGEARRRVAEAGLLGARRSLAGQPLPPLLPETAAALSAGAISPHHVRVIVETLTRLPDHVDSDERQWAEATLVGHAATFTPSELARIAARVLDQLDPDGPAPVDDERPRCELHLRPRPDGRLGLSGELDPEGSAALQAVLDALRAAPQQDQTQQDQTQQDPAQAGQAPRSRPERDADALVEACHQLLGQGELPEVGGDKPHVAVTVGLAELEHRTGAAMLDRGARISAEAARRLACDAQVIPVVLGSRSEPLDVGRISYTVPAGMRRALIARDRGCTFPACGRAPAYCHAHHRRHWADGGETRLDDLVLLCEAHHRLIHHSAWEVHVLDGQPVFTPPAWINPERQPLRNPLRC